MSATLTLTRFDATRWVARSSSGHHLLVGAVAKAILEAATLNADRDAAFRALAMERPDITRARFDETLASLDRLLAKPAGAPVTRANLTVLDPAQVARFASIFAPLFHRAVFLPLLIVITIASAWLSGYQIDLKAAQCVLQTPLDVAIVTLLVLATALVHELGHAAALLARGRQPGKIGVGMYAYILPVAWVDLDNAWTLPLRDRLVVNLGGITTHLIFGLIVAGAAQLIPSHHTLLHGASLTIFALAAMQLLPFLRRDGYWAAVDLLGTPNLASTPLLPSLRTVRRGPTATTRAKAFFAASYVFANTAFLAMAAYLLLSPVAGIVENLLLSVRNGVLVPSLLSLQTFMTLLAAGLVSSAVYSRLRRLRSGEGH